MNIQRIHIRNVKSYADETLSFKEGINIIGGANGAGKTTIIESIGYGLFGKIRRVCLTLDKIHYAVGGCFFEKVFQKRDIIPDSFQLDI
jgi:DNA repair exonuclease SbcCD ATPase subunit